MLETKLRKQYRAIGHHLKPVVMIADKGVSESVLKEINRALDDHELIKINIKLGDREAMREVIDQLCEQLNAELVQTIGKMALLLRPNPKAKPQLSNLTRAH